MSDYSQQLLSRLESTSLALPTGRPRLLLGEDEVETVRERARTVPGLVDSVRERARTAALDDSLARAIAGGSYMFHPFLNILEPLMTAVLVLDDDQAAARALETVEAYFSVPTQGWPPPARLDMRCHLAIPGTSGLVGVAMDLCAEYWSPSATRSISERISGDLLPRFLETWRKQDEIWATPGYNFNWKISNCGSSGLGALACGEVVPNLPEVLLASLEGVLAVLDTVPDDGDWPEGGGYFLGSVRHGLEFGLALRRATDGDVDLFTHPAFQKAGDFIMHVTEPDGGFYDFADCPAFWPADSAYDAWGTMSLLAMGANRGDWARTARMRDRWSMERLLWDDPALESREPPEQDTARHFGWTGVATMRSGWDADATFVGFISGPNDKSHAQLDANSFVVSSRGERLLIDEGKWPYAALLGFFDYDGPRFDFDANATIGHNSLLVDGQGQHSAGKGTGAEYFGKIVDFRPGPDVDIVVGDATAAYDGRLDRFVRALAFVKPDLILVFDRVASKEPRYLEWLFHHDGQIGGDEDLTTITRGDVGLTLARVLPEEADCWRMSDVERTSTYTDSNTLKPGRARIRYRSFGPFHPVTSMDVLWAIHVGDPGDRPKIEAAVEDSTVKVRMTFEDGSEKIVTL